MPGAKPPKDLKRKFAQFLYKTKRDRHRARTDLMYLVREVLGYDRFEDEVHGPACRHLASFADVQGTDRLNGTNYIYEPRAQDPADVMPLWPRRRVYMDPRGWYKTTLNVIGHTTQILLNFPSCTVFLCHAQQEIINEKLREMKQKFFPGGSRLNELFPEFCDGLDLKGRMDQLWLPPGCGRKNHDAPNASTSSITSTTAGMHYGWMKFTDIVEHQNSQTAAQKEKVRKGYNQFLNLLVSPRHFVDLEGTCYAYDDALNTIIKQETKRIEEGKKRVYSLFVRGCFKKQPPKGQKESFMPWERRWDYAFDSEEKRISRFESQFPLEHYEVLEDEDPQEFANNQLNDPRMAMKDTPFPLERMSRITPQEANHVNFQSFHMTVDTAETVTAQSDETAMWVCGIDRFGRTYAMDGWNGRALPDEISRNIVRLYTKWKCRDLRIERSSFNRGYFPSLKRYLDLTGLYINFRWLTRDTNEGKKQRILGLQDAYKSGELRFNTDLPKHLMDELEVQLSEFPSSAHDDVLDALADQFQDRVIFGAQRTRPAVDEIMRRAQELRLQRHFEETKIYPQAVDAAQGQHTGSL